MARDEPIKADVKAHYVSTTHVWTDAGMGTLIEHLMGDAASSAGLPYTHTFRPEPERRWVLEDGSEPVPPLHNDGLVDEFRALIVVDADGDRCYLSE